MRRFANTACFCDQGLAYWPRLFERELGHWPYPASMNQSPTGSMKARFGAMFAAETDAIGASIASSSTLLLTLLLISP